MPSSFCRKDNESVLSFSLCSQRARMSSLFGDKTAKLTDRIDFLFSNLFYWDDLIGTRQCNHKHICEFLSMPYAIKVSCINNVFSSLSLEKRQDIFSQFILYKPIVASGENHTRAR